MCTWVVVWVGVIEGVVEVSRWNSAPIRLPLEGTA